MQILVEALPDEVAQEAPGLRDAERHGHVRRDVGDRLRLALGILRTLVNKLRYSIPC